MFGRMQLRSIPFCLYVDPTFPATFFFLFASTLEQAQQLVSTLTKLRYEIMRGGGMEWDGVGDSGGRSGVHGHFCSSDVLYLQKTDLYLGFEKPRGVHVLVDASVLIEAPRTFVIVQRLSFR